MQIIIPEKFKEILDNGDKKFNAIIFDIISNFENFLNSSNLEFFPEYNNHGFTHLNNILKIQDNLITKESFSLLTIEDVTVLIIATTIHDIAMHINYDGFKTLLNSSKEWNEKWIAFFQEAKRYNEERLIKLFGDNQPIIDLPEKKIELNNKDYLLIGEFLRINHPKLSKEILEKGFPLANGNFKKIINTIDEKENIIKFATLLSESHGKNIRDTFDEIETIGRKGDLISPYNIHIVYLMVILRVSDYLDIYENRNPKIMVGLKNFMSEISKFEWDKNTSVEEIKEHWHDTEAIFIGVSPKDSNSYLNLKKLFKGIQYELDISWAILGEIYSKDERLRNLKISYRRIRSDIDNEEEFGKKIEYLPRKINFSADSELLKLLVAPLYGDEPHYGVRELLQNSVDACKERKKIDDNFKSEIKVDIYEDSNKYYFSIIDNGIGMEEDTIINYLLKAGASFRNSKNWKENFTDTNNNSTIERTGRFGVGLLASFLIGNNISIQTRYFKSNLGYKFNTKLNENQINILKDTDIEIGTSIKIEMNKIKYDNLNKVNYESDINWKRWYVLDDINITYNGQKIDNLINKDNFIEINQDKYNSVKWCYETDFKYSRTICNGFIIHKDNIKLKSNYDFNKEKQYYYYYNNTDILKKPSIFILDKEGKSPLNLNRGSFLISEYCFQNKLIESIISEFFKAFCNHKIKLSSIINNIDFKYPKSDFLDKKIIFNKKGFNLFTPHTLINNKIELIILIELTKNYNGNLIRRLINYLLEKEISFYIDINDNVPSNGYSKLFEELNNLKFELSKDIEIKSANIYLPNLIYPKVFTYKNTSVKVGLKDKLINFEENYKQDRTIIPAYISSEHWSLNYFIKEEKSIFDLKILDEYKDDIALISEVFIDISKVKEKNNINYFLHDLMENRFKNENSWISYEQDLLKEINA